MLCVFRTSILNHTDTFVDKVVALHIGTDTSHWMEETRVGGSIEDEMCTTTTTTTTTAAAAAATSWLHVRTFQEFQGSIDRFFSLHHLQPSLPVIISVSLHHIPLAAMRGEGGRGRGRGGEPSLEDLKKSITLTSPGA